MSTHRMALIVVDMLVDFFDRRPELASERGRLVAAVNDLARGFRSRGQPVVWVRQEFKPDWSDAPLEIRRLGVRVTIEGTEGCRILPDLDRADGDPIVVKKRYSAFFRTDLEEILRGLGPAVLVLAGVNTHACVRMTAIDAYQRDYDVILAEDCIASYDAEFHRETLRYLDGKIARVMSNREILAAASVEPPSSRPDTPGGGRRT